MVQGGLRGDLPGRIKPDVWRWLGLINLVFEIDGVAYRLLVEKPAGETDQKHGNASLSRQEGDTWLPLYEGSLGAPLEQAVEDVLMPELGFVKYQAFSERNGSNTHGWPTIVSALFVNGPAGAIFGDQIADGMPLRLLQMFMGLPWISTYSAAATALKRIQADDVPAGGGPDEMRAQLNGRLVIVQKRLDEARASIRPGSDRVELRERLVAGDGRLVELRRAAEIARSETVRLEQLLAGARTVLADTRRSLQQLRDEKAAGFVLRTLRPICCPSCDTGIDNAKYVAAEAGETCALCGTRHVEPSAEEGLRIDDLQADVADSEETIRRLERDVSVSRARRDAAETGLAAAVDTMRSIEADLAYPGTASLELEIRGLEAQAEQLRELAAEQEDPDARLRTSDDVRVLKAAVNVTRSLYDGLAREILVDVSRELTRLSHLFGVRNIESMEWGTGGALRIVQGGTVTSFTKLTQGENLRVRIAAALAVIEVARQRHYGRHPGLLVLDSPAAQEMTGEDFAALLASVQTAIEQVDDIQVIVGAVARPELLGIVPFDRTTHAAHDDFLF